MEGFIPDGQLCSGGNTNFTGFNVPGDWPLTHLTSGAALSWKYSNWAHHPGTFSMYITNDGWDRISRSPGTTWRTRRSCR